MKKREKRKNRNASWHRGKKNCRGIFFSIDGILASGIIILALILLSSFYLNKPNTVNMNYNAEDLAGVLSNIKVGELNNSYKDYLINSSIIKDYDLNKSILEIIGKLYVTGHEAEASELFQNISSGLFDNRGYGLYLDKNTIFEKNLSNKERNNIISFPRVISGIEEEKPIEGYTARAFIKSIDGKTFSNYIFFGGLEGQGNLTTRMELPDFTNITKIYLEFDAESNFSLFINNNSAGTFPQGCTGGGFMRAYKCYVNESYFNLLHQGTNKIEIRFNNDLNHSYIGGGFLRVNFDTTNLNYSDINYNEDENLASQRDWLIGVKGVINKYSSLYIPGNLTGMEMFLNFSADYPLFVNLGNTTIYDGNINNDTGNVTVILNNSKLSSMLNYSNISLKTLPLRMGHTEVKQVGIIGHKADVVLITDLSGSMKWRFDSDDTGTVRNCSDPLLYDNSTRRISVAKCLDKQFVDVIMNESNPGNRMWLVDFNDDANSYYSDNKSDLENHIDNYPDDPSGGTCICCAVNEAYNILNANSNSSRDKFVVVMTDGLPTYCCGKELDYCVWWWCYYKCQTTGNATSYQYYSSSCGGGSDDCTGSDCEGPINSSIYSAYRVHTYQNATVDTIGFGPVSNCTNANYTLTEMAYEGNGSYFASQDPSKLANIYLTIARRINNKSAIYEYQRILVNNVTSELYDNSYILINYTPLNKPYVYGKIPLRIETDSFNNNITQGEFLVPENTSVIEGYATSYSSYYWSNNLTINSKQVFNLNDFGSEYNLLGDPFIINIPINKINIGNNSVIITTASAPGNYTGGSPDDKVIYTLLIKNFVSYSAVESKAEGCNWTVYFEDGSNTTLIVPDSYSGTNYCIYNASISGTHCTYNGDSETNDAINKAICQLLTQLDPDKNGKINVKVSQDNLKLDTIVIKRVPSLWGPAILRLNIWN